MKKIKELFPGIIALLVIGAVLMLIINAVVQWLASAGMWFLDLVEVISTLDTVLIIALASGVVTILGLVVNSIISVYIKASEHRNKIKAELRIKMEKPYREFVNLIYDMIMDTKKKKSMSENEIMTRMIEMSKEITLWGSNKVIKRWGAYRKIAGNCPPQEGVIHIENLLFAIREDLGIKKGHLKKGDLLALFINDIDEFLKKS